MSSGYSQGEHSLPLYFLHITTISKQVMPEGSNASGGEGTAEEGPGDIDVSWFIGFFRSFHCC